MFDLVWYVDNLPSWDHLVESSNEAVENLIEPKAILAFAVLVEIVDFGTMKDLALSA